MPRETGAFLICREEGNMKYLITGANGQLGKELQHLLTEKNLEFVAFGSSELDITDSERVREVLAQENPDFVFDAAAYTAVDAAEDEGKELNWAVNAKGTENLAQASKLSNATFVYISTDYVFDGTNENHYREDDLTNPMNEYGKAKLAGEKAVTMSGVDYYIIRTSWVFGAYGNNFVFTMQKLAQNLDKLNVVNDQHGRPTWTKTLAEFMLFLSESRPEQGIYHLSNDNEATWYEFAKEILKESDIEIFPVASDQFPQKAYRPKHSVMSLDKVKKTGFEIPTWQQALAEFL